MSDDNSYVGSSRRLIGDVKLHVPPNLGARGRLQRDRVCEVRYAEGQMGFASGDYPTAIEPGSG